MATVASLRMLSIGPVQFPVDVLSIIPSPQSLRNVCCGDPESPHDPTALTMPKKCQFCGEITDPSKVKKAAKVAGGYVLIDEETQKKLSERIDTRKIVLRVHQEKEFHASTVPGQKSYWLKPSKDSDPSGYQLFSSIVREMSDYVFVAVWAARTKPAMFELTVMNNVLVITERVHVEEANPAPQVIQVPIRSKDADNMKLIAQSNVEPFRKEDYTDDTLTEVLAGATPVALHGDKSEQVATVQGDISSLLEKMVNEISAEEKKEQAKAATAAKRRAARAAKVTVDAVTKSKVEA